ncbi:MAG: fumarylacetoacetate hydrolase family protein [Chloroflexi bacterium]|nr:fumarylacetoacetate hydrolase family protein [Chloroflexota bacterium]
MKLVTIDTPYGLRVGAMEADGYVDLNAAENMRIKGDFGRAHHRTMTMATESVPEEMMRFLAGGKSAIEAARQALAFAQKQDRKGLPWYPLDTPLGAPVPNPGKLYVMRGNYRGHVMEVAARISIDTTPPDRPRFFAKATSCVVGPGKPVILPRLSKAVQHEVELAVIIGKRARNVSIEQADEYIAGYTIFLDMSARDLSQRDDRWKSFDTFGPMGPCWVPVADIGDPHKLSIKLSVNGEVHQNGTTADLDFKVQQIVSFMSEAYTLHPGDMISTGTPEGAQVIKVGDVMEAEIENIGTFTIPVVAET